MIDRKLSYSAIIFVNARDITATTDTFSTLLDMFRDASFIPGTISEFGILGTMPQPVLRPQLQRPKEGWSIEFLSERINIEKVLVDVKEDSMGELGEFALVAVGYFRRILEKFDKKANRLSLVTSFLLAEMTPSTLTDTYRRLFRAPHFYEDYAPFEWDWRSASQSPYKVADLDEQLNVGMTLKRQKIQFGGRDRAIPLDRVTLMFDINTIRESAEYRFGFAEIQDFFKSIVAFHNGLQEQTMEFIDEQPE